MRIREIEINNFRAFYGEYKINLDKNCQNLMLYGENGSGKSSLFYALKYLFESSENNLNFKTYENIFLKASEKNTGYVKATFFEKNANGKWSNKTEFNWDSTEKTPGSIMSNPNIIDTNKTKAFLDYKKLLKTHLIDLDRVDIFDLLIGYVGLDSSNIQTGIISHVKTRTTKKEFIQDWIYLNDLLKESIELSAKPKYKAKQQDQDNIIKKINDQLVYFNDDIENFLKFDSPIDINDLSLKTLVNNIIDVFNYNLIIDFKFSGIKLSEDMTKFEDQNIFLDVNFGGYHLPNHHYFLNEARLTALSIAIFLSSILKQPPQNKYKILFLDDIFTGLDMANREPIIDILRDKFSDYQIFITTYDKQWFELFRQYTESDKKWKYIQMYSKRLSNTDFEIPIIDDEIDFIAKAEEYLKKPDYKASAVYIRTAFEEILKKFCDENNIKVKYKIQQKKLSSEDFWTSVKDYKMKITKKRETNEVKVISESLKNKIERYKGTVMNPFSHYDLDRPQFKNELSKSIDIVKKLKEELNSFKKITIKNKI